jgi:hypothetical protein
MHSAHGHRPKKREIEIEPGVSMRAERVVKHSAEERGSEQEEEDIQGFSHK